MSTQYMRKETPFQDSAAWGKRTYEVNSLTLQKIASESYLPPRIEAAIRQAQASADPSQVVYFDRALGAGEYYGANNNGDYFPSEMLRKRAGTFETHAKLYRNHVTTDEPIGDVLASAYNDRLHTVDLLIRAPISKVANDDERLAQGFTIKTSMGCMVPYDVCSCCGNVAKTRADYCMHAKFAMLKMVNGRQVYVINEDGTFGDISIVGVPAAPESAIIAKVAGDTGVMKRAGDGAIHVPQPYGMSMSSKMLRTPAMQVMDERELRGAISSRVISTLSHFKLADAVATAHEAFGVLRPDEYAALIRKDASRLRPDVIPVLSRGVEQPVFLQGSPNYKVAQLLCNMPREAASHEVKMADWLDDLEIQSYTAYRNSLPFGARMDSRFLYLR